MYFLSVRTVTHDQQNLAIFDAEVALVKTVMIDPALFGGVVTGQVLEIKSFLGQLSLGNNGLSSGIQFAQDLIITEQNFRYVFNQHRTLSPGKDLGFVIMVYPAGISTKFFVGSAEQYFLTAIAACFG